VPFDPPNLKTLPRTNTELVGWPIPDISEIQDAVWRPCWMWYKREQIQLIFHRPKHYPTIKHEVDWTCRSEDIIIWRFQYERNLKVTWPQMRTNIKHLAGQNLNTVLEYHNSPLVSWVHAWYSDRLKSAVFTHFRPLWPWPCPRIGSSDKPSCPLPTNQILCN